jgi:hypothetical protein
MKAEPAKVTENVRFRFPALVSLAPKRRWKMTLPSAPKEAEPEKEEASPTGEIHHRVRLKKSGRVIFHRPADRATAIRVIP